MSPKDSTPDSSKSVPVKRRSSPRRPSPKPAVTSWLGTDWPVVDYGDVIGAKLAAEMATAAESAGAES